jgi:hypothetical protein
MTEFYVNGANESIIPVPLNTCDDSCVNGSTYAFEKGYTPPPFSVTGFDEGNGIRINFNQTSGLWDSEECVCAIECVGVPSVIDPNGLTGVFCPAATDYVYDFSLSSIVTGDVSTFSFSFIDSSGNTGVLEINSLIYTKAQAPSRVVLKENNYYYAEIGIPFSSISGKNLIPHIDHYKIEVYEHNTGNARTLYGWSKFDSFSSPEHILNRKHGVITTRINSGMEYGFRVSYRNMYDESSIASDWATAKDTDYVPTS